MFEENDASILYDVPLVLFAFEMFMVRPLSCISSCKVCLWFIQGPRELNPRLSIFVILFGEWYFENFAAWMSVIGCLGIACV